MKKDIDELMMYRRNALLANLCKEWDSKWSACHDDKEKLMELVLMQQSAPHFATFCYNGGGLSRDYCLKHFGDFVNGRVFRDCDGVKGYTYGMFINAPTALEMALDVSQYLWCDNIRVDVPKTKCPKMYVSNNSTMHLTLDGYNYVQIYIFDESKVVIDDADDTCNVIVYKYSTNATIERGKFCLAGIKEFDKKVRL